MITSLIKDNFQPSFNSYLFYQLEGDEGNENNIQSLKKINMKYYKNLFLLCFVLLQAAIVQNN